MKAIVPIAAGLVGLAAAAPPAEDREAILAMAGTFEVDFHFEETVAVAPDYECRDKPYQASATEVVRVVDDQPQRITLQHLLLVSGDEDEQTRVIKHWAQVWTWQDRELLDYAGVEGDDDWKCVDLSAEQAAGTWSQLVTSVDDTPRYEGYGRWIHHGGESSWSSSPTRRPLPRREYTKRDDYDYLLVTNRHTITPDGWVHFQDNRKVVDRGEGKTVLCYETGLNRYRRNDSARAEVAHQWWEANGAFWDGVREFWVAAGEDAPNRFRPTPWTDGKGLSEVLDRLEEESADATAIARALEPYADAR